MKKTSMLTLKNFSYNNRERRVNGKTYRICSTGTAWYILEIYDEKDVYGKRRLKPFYDKLTDCLTAINNIK